MFSFLVYPVDDELFFFFFSPAISGSSKPMPVPAPSSKMPIPEICNTMKIWLKMQVLGGFGDGIDEKWTVLMKISVGKIQIWQVQLFTKSKFSTSTIFRHSVCSHFCPEFHQIYSLFIPQSLFSLSFTHNIVKLYENKGRVLNVLVRGIPKEYVYHRLIIDLLLKFSKFHWFPAKKICYK